MTGLYSFPNSPINGGTSGNRPIAGSLWKIITLKFVVAILVFYLFIVIINTIVGHAYLLTLVLICIDLVIMTIANLFIWS